MEKAAVCSDAGADFTAAVTAVSERERPTAKMRKRVLKTGPVLPAVQGLSSVPMVVGDGVTLTYACDFTADALELIGLSCLHKGYPLGGDYGEAVASVTVTFADGTEQTVMLRNGEDVTTVFGLNLSSCIEPWAENSPRLAVFGYNKNFERYILNVRRLPLPQGSAVRRVTVVSADNGYDLLVYGIIGE